MDNHSGTSIRDALTGSQKVLVIETTHSQKRIYWDQLVTGPS